MIENTIDEILSLVKAELISATEYFGKFNSSHEGYAVLKEEVDELWDEIKGHQRSEEITKEAIQVAAMAVRLILDCIKGKDE